MMTFVVKLTFHCGFCGDCVSTAKEIVQNIEGVNSIDINTENGLATISGNVPPHTVIEELTEKFLKKKNDKTFKAELVEKVKHLSKVREQKLQIVSSQNHVQKSLIVSQHLPEQRKATREAKSLSKVNKQNLKPISTQNHRSTSRRVSPQPPATRKPKVNTIQNAKPFKCDKCNRNMELESYTKPFKCDGCREDGFGKRYRCVPCNREFHEVCMLREPNIIHEVFERRTLAFSQEPGNICDACGRKIYGYSYSCKADKLYLHPCCSKLEGKFCNNGKKFMLHKKEEGECFFCGKQQHDEVRGWCYVFDSVEYKIYCHVYCASNIMCEAWKSGQLDRKDKVDYAFMAEKLDLEKLGLKLDAYKERSGGGVRTMFLKLGCAVLGTVINALSGNLLGVIPLATEILNILLEYYSKREKTQKLLQN